MSSSDEDDAYVPALPPGFKKKQENSSNIPTSRTNEKGNKYESSGSDDESYVPALPPHLQNPSKPKKNDEESGDSDEDAYLPALPAKLQNQSVKRKDDHEFQQNKLVKVDSDVDSEEDDMYGPVLPPHLMKKQGNISPRPSTKRVLGPTLPAGFVPPESHSSFSKSDEDEDIDEDDDEEDDDRMGIGPMPSSVSISEREYRIQQFELRAQRMKDKLEGKFDESEKPIKRETWMLELPEDKPNFCGLAPRQFRRKAPEEKGDRSAWTDLPADKERKAQGNTGGREQEQEEVHPEDIAAKLRDDDLAARVENYNQDKRATPLIDLHKKKLKKKEDMSGPKERKPFSREDDLNVNKFDEAQKK